MFTRISKITFLIGIFLIPVFTLATNNLKAEEDPSTYPEIADGVEVCTDKNYQILEEGNTQDRVIYVINDHNQLVKIENTNRESTGIKFSKGSNTLTLLTIPYDMDSDLDFSNVSKMMVNVKECTPEDGKKASSYDTKLMKVNLIAGDNKISFEAPTDVDKYKLEYRELNTKLTNTYKFKEDESITLKNGEILQITESYNNGTKDIVRYFEIENNNGNIFARNVKSFDVKSIEVSDVVTWKTILFVIVLIILFMFFRAKYRKNRKNYKKYLIKKKKKRMRKRQ